MLVCYIGTIVLWCKGSTILCACKLYCTRHAWDSQVLHAGGMLLSFAVDEAHCVRFVISCCGVSDSESPNIPS